MLSTFLPSEPKTLYTFVRLKLLEAVSNSVDEAHPERIHSVRPKGLNY